MLIMKKFKESWTNNCMKIRSFKKSSVIEIYSDSLVKSILQEKSTKLSKSYNFAEYFHCHLNWSDKLNNSFLLNFIFNWIKFHSRLVLDCLQILTASNPCNFQADHCMLCRILLYCHLSTPNNWKECFFLFGLMKYENLQLGI